MLQKYFFTPCWKVRTNMKQLIIDGIFKNVEIVGKFEGDLYQVFTIKGGWRIKEFLIPLDNGETIHDYRGHKCQWPTETEK